MCPQECYNLKADPLEVRNLAYPGTVLTPTERFHLNRLQARLKRVTTARLGPIPGFEWDLNISANLTGLGPGPQHQSMGGLATGKPIGFFGSQMMVNVYWTFQGQAKGTFWISARTGQIVGTMHVVVSGGAGNTLEYVGSAWVTGGTNAYRGFSGIRGWPLAVRMTTDANGKVGRISLQGRVTSSAVNGEVTLGPLNPFTGL